MVKHPRLWVHKYTVQVMNVTLLQKVQASIMGHTLIPFKIDLGFTLAHLVSVENKL